MKKLLLILCILALSAGLLFGLNTVQASLLFRLHLTNYEILWDQVEEDYDARFVLAKSGDTLTVAVYQRSPLGWKYLISNSGEDYAVTALSLYSQAQKDASGIWQSNMSVGRGIGSTSLNTEESSEVNQFYGDIKTYIEQSVLEFIIGNRDLAEFDEYVSHIEGMGIDKVTACYQDAYQRYLNGEVAAPAGPPGPPPDGAPPPG